MDKPDELAEAMTTPATPLDIKSNGLVAESGQVPAPYQGGCVAVFHNLCGRRTLRKSCDCQTCRAALSAAGGGYGE